MLSLYIHIPFCQSKCKYCAFTSFPLANQSEIVNNYIDNLKSEIKIYSDLMDKPSLKTIYFGGGTPNLLGAGVLIDLIYYIEQYFDCEDIGEISFEFNPYPEDEIYQIVTTLQKTFGKKYPRIRFSFGIQSFDNEVLSLSGRKSSFVGLVDFLRGLQPLKQETTVFNFDFIAFGKWNKSKKGNPYLWTPTALEFFSDFVNSGFADSFSLYTLELFENQARKKKDPDALISGAYFGDDEQVYEEFNLLKNIILDAGYTRYEISNFALSGKSSIHNRTYREMEDYLGVGLNSSSFLNIKSLNNKLGEYFGGVSEGCKGIRFKNTMDLKKYCAGDYLDKTAFEYLLQKDYLIESFFLGLRTDRGVMNIKNYKNILVPDFEKKFLMYEKEGLLVYENDRLVLTDQGLDVFNAIVTDLMSEI